MAQITKSANSEAHFSETRSETILEPFWVDFGSTFGCPGAPKSEKRVPEAVLKKVNKKSCKSYGKVMRERLPDLGQGGGVPYKDH